MLISPRSLLLSHHHYGTPCWTHSRPPCYSDMNTYAINFCLQFIPTFAHFCALLHAPVHGHCSDSKDAHHKQPGRGREISIPPAYRRAAGPLICQDQQTFVRKSIYGNHFLNTVFYGKVQPAAFLHPQRTISFCLAVMCMHYEYHAYTRISLYSYRDAMLPASVRKRHHTISIRRTQAALIEAASLNMVAMAANPNYRGHSEESLANKTSFR